MLNWECRILFVSECGMYSQSTTINVTVSPTPTKYLDLKNVPVAGYNLCTYCECIYAFVFSTGTRGLGPNVMATLRTRWLLSILLCSLQNCFAKAGEFVSLCSDTVEVQLLLLRGSAMLYFSILYFHQLFSNQHSNDRKVNVVYVFVILTNYIHVFACINSVVYTYYYTETNDD